MSVRNQKRRVLFNDDGEQTCIDYEGYSYNIIDEVSFINARTAETFNTHVDTYVWCVGTGSSVPWSKRAEYAMSRII